MVESGYDANKDKLIKRVKVTISEHGYLEVDVKCYDEGKKKLEIKRLIKDKNNEWIYVKLRRLTLKESLKLMGAIDKLKDALGWTPEFAEELAKEVEQEKEAPPEEKKEESVPVGSESERETDSSEEIEENIVY